MKSEIHPQYYPESKITCACGNEFTLGSTRESMEIEVCSACHPFYTGKDKVMDSVGQVQKFKARLEKKQAAPKPKRKKKKEEDAEA